jgi:DNA-binding LytR/AlgR family response regulator
MLRAVIVEDELIVANHLKTILQKNDVEVIDIVDNPKDAEDILKLSPDFYLLDIRLVENSNGLEIGKKLNNLKIPFIYITANNEISIIKKAVATNPLSYISKPFNERDVLAAIELLKIKFSNKRFLQIITPKGKQNIPEQNILYCEANGSYIYVVTEDNKYTQRITIKEVTEKLSDNFVRIHRSYLINTSKITFRKASSIFIGEKEIFVSRFYKNNLPNE